MARKGLLRKNDPQTPSPRFKRIMKTMTKKIITERAHYMCPNMHFAIAIEIEAGFDEAKIKKTVDDLKMSHPLLMSVIEEDEYGNPIYVQKADIQVPVFIRENHTTWLADYDEVTSEGWNLRCDCLLRVIAYPKEKGTFLVFAAHHLLCDGMALWKLAASFADIYMGKKDVCRYEDRIIEAMDEFGGNLKTSFMVKCITSSANKKWRKAGKKVSYDGYRQFERNYLSNDSVKKTISSLGGDQLGALIDGCKANNVTVNDFLVAQMMVSQHTNRVVVGSDVRKLFNNYEEGSLGNYSSAYSIEVKKSGDVWSVAKAVSKAAGQIKNNPSREMLTLLLYASLDQNLLDAAPISALGGFESEAGLFVGDRLLGFRNGKNHTITNLGKHESESITRAYFVPPCSPSVKMIVGVITLNGVMNKVVCSR